MQPAQRFRVAVWHNLPSGGGKRALYDHVKGLVSRGHHVEAWCPQTADSSYLPLGDLIEEHVVSLEMEAFDNPSRRAIRATKTIQCQFAAMDDHCRRCASQIAGGDFDLLFANACMFFRAPLIARHVAIPNVLYLQEPYRELYEAGPALVWAAAPASSPSVNPVSTIMYLIRDAIKTHARRIQVREERTASSSFQTILVNSLFSRESLLRAYGLESKVCYLGIDNSLFRPTGEPKERFVIGLGGLHFNKGVDRAVRALAQIPFRERPKLVWVGNFSDLEEESSVRTLAKECRVDFELKVRVADTELVSLLSRAALMVYTSRLEPFGYAPLEANACGTAVVATAEGGVRETVRNGVNGLLVNSADPKELARSIELLLDDDALTRKLGEQGRGLVESEWGLEEAIDRLENCLFGSLNGQRNAHSSRLAEPVETGN